MAEFVHYRPSSRKVVVTVWPRATRPRCIELTLSSCGRRGGARLPSFARPGRVPSASLSAGYDPSLHGLWHPHPRSV